MNAVAVRSPLNPPALLAGIAAALVVVTGGRGPRGERRLPEPLRLREPSDDLVAAPFMGAQCRPAPAKAGGY